MFRRLTGTYIALLLALGVPLGYIDAQRESQALFIRRLSDTTRFASLAEPALREGRDEALSDEIRRNDELFGLVVLIVDRDERIVLASRDPGGVQPATYQRQVRQALVDLAADQPEIVWPWDDGPLVVAEPVGRESRVVGAVVTIAPTGALRARILLHWGLLALCALVVAAVGARPLARWMVRPIRDLDAAMSRVAREQYGQPVLPIAGPVELRRLGIAFNTMADAVAASHEREQAFVADAAHQLRNPLTALRLQIDALETHLDDDGRQTYLITVEEVERLAEILHDLLLLARAEVPSANLGPVDLPSLVATRLDAWKSRFADRGVALRYEGNAVRPALATSALLGHALDALLDNALQYSGWTPVSVRLAEAGDWVDLHVTDLGPGLSADERAHAAERFWRGGCHHHVDGTGLGLAIVKATVERCGGSLSLLPHAPQGLDVRMRLPAAPVAGLVNGAPGGSSAARRGEAGPGTSRSPTAG